MIYRIHLLIGFLVMALLTVPVTSAAQVTEQLQSDRIARADAVVGKRYEMLDQDKDGRLDFSEAIVMRHNKFKKLDKNGDDKITLDEYQDIGSTPLSIDPIYAQRLEKVREQREIQFKGYDVNADKALSQDEFNQNAKKQFDLRDDNQDGFLSLAEWKDKQNKFEDNTE